MQHIINVLVHSRFPSSVQALYTMKYESKILKEKNLRKLINNFILCRKKYNIVLVLLQQQQMKRIHLTIDFFFMFDISINFYLVHTPSNSTYQTILSK